VRPRELELLDQDALVSSMINWAGSIFAATIAA
jgi:hypothetical protein